MGCVLDASLSSEITIFGSFPRLAFGTVTGLDEILYCSTISMILHLCVAHSHQSSLGAYILDLNGIENFFQCYIVTKYRNQHLFDIHMKFYLLKSSYNLEVSLC
ncbi:unnamed protein product [Citrullus colocynthis]|uniref:Uncharacterized protein n=1 Tax=Citrullus colocynthis TaxID=252529 RepID=A0ABP0XWL7_9ROSI